MSVLQRAVSCVCVLVIAMATHGRDTHAQVLDLPVFERLSQAEREDVLRARLVGIDLVYDEYEVDENGFRLPFQGPVNEDLVLSGTGFLVTRTGIVLTALHNLIPQLDQQKYEIRKKKYTITHRGQDGTSMDEVVFQEFIYPRPDQIGSRELLYRDVAAIKIDIPDRIGNYVFENYLCADFNHVDINRAPDGLWLAKFVRHGNWEIDFEKNVNIQGPPREPGYGHLLKTTATIEASSSGSPVFLNGRVVGVAVENWTASSVGGESREIARGGFISPLVNFKNEDWALEIQKQPCLQHGEQLLDQKLTQQEFLLTKPEGTMALFAPTSDNSEAHWAFENTNLQKNTEVPSYLVSRKVLRKSSQCNRTESEIEFRINNNPRNNSNTCNFELKTKTFYTIQVLPDIDGRVNRSTRFYRSGTFYVQENSGRDGELDSLVPETTFCGGKTRCGKNLPISGTEFMNFHSKLDGDNETRIFQQTGEKHIHGRARDKLQAPSSNEPLYNYRLFWSRPKGYLENDIPHMKNYLIRYSGTHKSKTEYPVSFNFCVSEKWIGFYLHWQSAERCVDRNMLYIRFGK